MSNSKRIRGCFCAIIFAAGLVVSFAGSKSAVAGNVSVNFDQVILMRLAAPAADVIIGNPGIADVTPRSRTLLAITGKAFGTTNMIILDKDSNVLVEHQVSVTNGDNNYVAITRGGQRLSYSCDQFCEQTLTIGDDTAAFSALKAQIKDKAQTAGAAGGTSRGR